MKNLFIISMLCAFAFNSINILAHCDTMNGPVISAAKDALNKGRREIDINMGTTPG